MTSSEWDSTTSRNTSVVVEPDVQSSKQENSQAPKSARRAPVRDRDVIKHSGADMETLVTSVPMTQIGRGCSRQTNVGEQVGEDQYDFAGFPGRLKGYIKGSSKVAQAKPPPSIEEKHPLHRFRAVQQMLKVVAEAEELVKVQEATKARKVQQMSRDFAEHYMGPFDARLGHKLNGEEYEEFSERRLRAQLDGNPTAEEAAVGQCAARLSRIARIRSASRAERVRREEGSEPERESGARSVSQRRARSPCGTSAEMRVPSGGRSAAPPASGSGESRDTATTGWGTTASARTPVEVQRGRLEERARSRRAVWESRTREHLAQFDRGDYFDTRPQPVSLERAREVGPFPTIAVSTNGLDDRVGKWRKHAAREDELEGIVRGLQGDTRPLHPPAYDTFNLRDLKLMPLTRFYSEESCPPRKLGRRAFPAILRSDRVNQAIMHF